MNTMLLSAVAFLTATVQTPEMINDHVGVYRHLEFVSHSDGALQLDLYVPGGAGEPVPAIIVIPGGGFRSQVKEKFAAEAQRLAEAGFAAASIGYRGSPEHTFLATVHDTKAAVRFIRANAAQFNIDPDLIGAFGQSAGGHLAGMLAVTGDSEKLEGEAGTPGVSSRVQAAVSFAGAFDFISRLRDGGHQGSGIEEKRAGNGAWIGEHFSAKSAAWKLASPYYHISEDDPPLLLVHCKDDATVPYQQSVQMYNGMKTIRPESRLLLFEKGGHSIRTSPLVRDEAWSWTIAFFREHLVREEPDDGSAQPEAPFEPAVPPTHTNVSYGPYARNLMDVWEVETATPAPVLVSIHGGGFHRGDKKISNRLLRECLASGIAVVTITYRFTDEAIAPAQFEDAARAIQFTRHNAKDWNIDPERIASSGGSAGAGMSLWLAFHDDMADPDSSDPVLRQSTRLTCVAVDNGQTSYDPRFIRDLFPGTDTWLTTPLAHLFGVNLDELDDLPQEKYRLFEEVSALNHLTADDVPALLTYSSALDTPNVNRSIGIHHPRFGSVLKEKMDALGIECQVLDGLEGKDEERAAAMMSFVKRHFDVD